MNYSCFRIATQQQQEQRLKSGEAPVLTSEDPPLHSGELNHALLQKVAQPNPSYPAPCPQDHISMEHRLRRKNLLLNSDTDDRNETFLKERERRNHFLCGKCCVKCDV